jgi:hypothetical protein
MLSFIEEQFGDKDIRRHINIGITDILTGTYVTFTESEKKHEMTEVLKASVSYPGVFPALNYNDAMYTPGSTIYEMDVLSVINHCENLGYESKDIYIDVITTTDVNIGVEQTNNYNAIGNTMRAASIMKWYD